jgi:peptidoglycan/LPS O-acetylase OafA/YrhL
MVFIFHYGGGLRSPHAALRVLGHITEAGWIGVTLFFVLSGFLITGSLWDSQHQPHYLRNFFARRALRILPLYYFVLLISFLIALGRGSRFHDLGDFFVYVFFLQDLPVLATRVQQLPSPLPLYHLWSLAVEEQFYLIWPWLLMHVHSLRSALRLALGTFALSLAFLWIAYGIPIFARATPHSFDEFLLTHAGALGLGAALAITSRGKLWQTIEQHALRALGIAALVFLIAGFIAGGYTLSNRLQFAIGLPAATVAVATLLPIALRPGKPRTVFSWLPLRELGRISYGFYVFHILLQPIFDFIAHRLTHTTAGSLYQTARFVVAFPITAAVAWLSFHLLELPFLHSKKKYPMHPPLSPAVLLPADPQPH